MNINRLIRKTMRRTPNLKSLILPAGLLLLTVVITFTIMTLLNTPRAPRLKNGTGQSLYTAINKTYSAGIGGVGGSPQISFSRGESGIQFLLAGARSVKPVKASSTSVTFPSVLPGVDLVYTTKPNGIKEDLVLHQKPSSNTFLFDLSITNATNKQLTNSYLGHTFYTKDNQYLFHFEPPYAVDNNGNRTDNVILEIAEDKAVSGRYSMKLIVDETWLNDPARAYPIIVDPTIVHDTTVEFAAGTMNRVLDTGSGSDPRLQSYYHPLVADEYTVGLWHLDETADNSCSGGQDACDSSGNGLHGTDSGGSAIVDGVLNKARSLDGTNDFITVSDNNNLSFSNNTMTMEAWIKRSGLPAANEYFILKGISTWEYGAFVSTSGLVYGYIWTSAGATVASVGSTRTITDGNWHHVAITTDGRVMSIYIDGKLETSSYAFSGTMSNTAASLYFGDRSDQANTEFQGQIDDIRLSSIARSPEEIKLSASRRPYATYTSEVLDLGGASGIVTAWNDLTWTELGVATGDGETLSDTSNLVAQWKFNETSGTALDNSAGSCGASCDGSLGGFSATSSQDQAAGTGWTSADRRWGAGALMFDGNDDYSGSGDPSALDFTDSFSMGVWVKTTHVPAAANYPSIMGKGFLQGGVNGYGLFLHGDNSGRVACQARNDATTSTAVGPFISDGSWHYVVCTRNHSTNTTIIYVDGVQTSSDTTALALGYSSDKPFGFGMRYSTSWGFPFRGTLDSAHIFSRVMTADEIIRNYQAGQIELQTRVGDTTNPNDGTWDAWSPATNETLLEGFENNEENTNVYEMGLTSPSVNPTWAKKNNTAAANSDTTSTDGRLGLGTNGTGDDSYIIGPSVLKDGSTYKMWYSGNDGANLRIYYATSSDGLTWTKYNNAIPSNSDTSSTDGRIPLGTNGTGDDFHAAYPVVIKDGSTYKMWYTGNDGTIWRIFYATSSDGLTWTKYNNSIESPSNTTGTQGRIPLGSSGGDANGTHKPAVIKDGTTYKLWYGGYDGTYWRIFYATSSDGLTWTKYNNATPSNSDTTSTDGRIPMGTVGTGDDLYTIYPVVIKDGSIYKMWYGGHDGTNWRIFYATSSDGLTWAKYDNSIPGTSNTTTTNGRVALGASGGDAINSYSPTIIKDGATYKMWYSGFDGSSVWRMYHASMTPIPLSQSTESVIKQESSYSEKFVTTPQVDGNVVGLWHLDETGGSGAYIKDSSGNGNHGTPSGTSIVNGLSGKARSMGSGNINVPDHTTLKPTHLTLEAWVKINSNGHIIYKYVNSSPWPGYGMHVGVITTGIMSCWVGGTAWTTATTFVNDNKWHHLACTYDGTNVRAYTDGLLEATQAQTANLSGALDLSLNSWTAGSRIIDEVRISNVARSAEEIAESYRLGRDHYINKTISSTDLSGKTTLPFYVAADRPGTYLQSMIGESAYTMGQPDQNTLGFWRLDELTGSSAYLKDSSTYNNHGTPTSTTSVSGKIGRGQYFTGASRVSLGSRNMVDNLANLTLDAWIYPTTQTAATHYRVFSEQSVLYVGQYGSQLTFFMGNGASWLITDITGGTLPLNKWSHVAWVKNGTSYSIYLNGQLIKSGTGAPATLGTSSNTNYLSTYDGTNQPWAGSLDEVRLSNTARSADEIRQAYEHGMGLRSHNITVDFGASLDSGNLIADSNDLSFTVDATVYGLAAKGSMLFVGDKIIVKENYNGTEYIAQGTVTAVTPSTGAVTVANWDSGSTFPSGGYTASATVFKWQREYWNIDGEVLDSSLDAITTLSLRLTDGAEGRTIYLDDLKSSGGYLTDPAGSTITSATGQRYFQYRAILSSSDEAVSPQLSAVTIDYDINVAPNTPSLDTPSDTVTGQSTTPTLQTTATDADSDYLRYKIELCENAGMSTNCQTYDQTSSQTGWSGQNAQTSTAYTSGTQATYTIVTPLSTGTTYYWRSYAIDPAGTNTWSATQGSPYSFTTNNLPTSPTNPWAEGATNPAGITDLTPELSAIHNDPDGDPAVFYEIEVNTNNTFTGTVLWDTGSTAMSSLANGARSSDVSYAGTALSWNATYYWRIRFTDSLGGVGAWSATQSFSTNNTPLTPSLNSPPNGSTKLTLTPTITLSTTDPDSDYLRYRLLLCHDYAMTSNCQTIDQTLSQTNWSNQDTQSTTAYQSGTQAIYTFTANLTPNLTHYLQLSAIDPAGTNTWSNYSSVTSFTTRKLDEGFFCLIDESSTDSQLSLSWADRESSEDNYLLERSVNGAAFTLFQTLPANTTSYVDSSISTGNTYQYRVAPYSSSTSSTGDWCTTNTLSLSLGSFGFSGLNFSGLNFN